MGKTPLLARGTAFFDNKSVQFIAIILGMLGIYVILLSRFDLNLLFTDTVLTGGDSCSWLQPLKHLKDDYLPHLRLFGYSHSNFFGYLEGQQYFVLPFFSAALLGFLMPLTVALKIATVAGAFALPLTMFFGVRSFTKNPWIALTGAAGSLFFLFNESYNMFGGNFLSTFAGEFCYSWAFAFFPLFIGSVWEDHTNEKWSMKSGLLLGAIGLCHSFVFMVAFFLPFFFALARRNVSPKLANTAPQDMAKPSSLVLRIPFTYIIAFLLMAFWLVPMATTRTWAQTITMIWRFNDFEDFAKQTLLPVWAGGFVALILAAILSRTSKSDLPRKALFLLYGLGSCAFYFLISAILEVPDIRFVPPALMISLFAFLLLFDNRVNGIKDSFAGIFRPIIAIAAVVAAAVIIPAMSPNAPSWFRWNYTGFEAKDQWTNLEKISTTYRGSIEDGRMLWEKQNQADNRDFGSERGFENLYYFTGHPSTEGINYGSSFMARAITYLQSTYSLNPVDPEADRLYSKVDPDAWPLRFTQANAHYIITYSPEITSLFASQPDFRLDNTFGKFSIFEYRSFPHSYVEQVDPQSISILQDSSGGFKTDFYRFFRDYELIRHPFVPASFADNALRDKITTTVPSYDILAARYRNDLSWKSYPAAPSLGTVADEKMDSFTISFKTTAIGKPHIIKSSYAPGWKSKHGEKIYPISPGWMLIYPTDGDVVLEYTRAPVEWIGIAGTLLLIPVFIFRKRIATWSLPFYRPVYIGAWVVFFGVVVVFLGLTFFGAGKLASDIEHAQHLDLNNIGQRLEAESIVDAYATPENLERYDNQLVFEAYRIKANILANEGKRDLANDLIDLLKTRYSHTRNVENLPKY